MVLLLILKAKPFLPSVQENLRVQVIHLHPEIKKKGGKNEIGHSYSSKGLSSNLYPETDCSRKNRKFVLDISNDIGHIYAKQTVIRMLKKNQPSNYSLMRDHDNCKYCNCNKLGVNRVHRLF